MEKLWRGPVTNQASFSSPLPCEWVHGQSTASIRLSLGADFHAELWLKEFPRKKSAFLGASALLFPSARCCTLFGCGSCYVRVKYALSFSDQWRWNESPANGWLYCGCWELPIFSNIFSPLLGKRFGVFLCKKNNTKAPTQKTASEKPCCHRRSLGSAGHGSAPPAGRQGRLGPPSCTVGVQGVDRQVPSTCGTEKGTCHEGLAAIGATSKWEWPLLFAPEEDSSWSWAETLLFPPKLLPCAIFAHKNAHNPPVLPWPLLCMCRFSLLTPFALFSLRATQCSAVFFLHGNLFGETGQNELWHVFKSNKDKN